MVNMKMKKRKKASLERKRARYGYLFTLPFILGVTFIFIRNMAQTFVFSINETIIGAGGYTLEWSGFSNYVKAFTKDTKFVQYVVSSLGEMLVQVPVIVIFSLFMAMVLNQKFKGRVVARAIFFLPVILSTGIISTVDAGANLDGIMSIRGALESGEAAASSLDFQQLLMSLNFNETLTDIVVGAANGISDIVNASGMQIFIFLAAFQQISPAVFEAAQVEGCSKWELFWKIIIPMTGKQIVVAAVYTVIDVFTRNDSELFEYVHTMAYEGNQYSYAMAMYVIYALGLGAMLGAVLLIIHGFTKKSNEGR